MREQLVKRVGTVISISDVRTAVTHVLSLCMKLDPAAAFWLRVFMSASGDNIVARIVQSYAVQPRHPNCAFYSLCLFYRFKCIHQEMLDTMASAGNAGMHNANQPIGAQMAEISKQLERKWLSAPRTMWLLTRCKAYVLTPPSTQKQSQWQLEVTRVLQVRANLYAFFTYLCFLNRQGLVAASPHAVSTQVPVTTPVFKRYTPTFVLHMFALFMDSDIMRRTHVVESYQRIELSRKEFAEPTRVLYRLLHFSDNESLRYLGHLGNDFNTYFTAAKFTRASTEWYKYCRTHQKTQPVAIAADTLDDDAKVLFDNWRSLVVRFVLMHVAAQCRVDGTFFVSGARGMQAEDDANLKNLTKFVQESLKFLFSCGTHKDVVVPEQAVVPQTPSVQPSGGQPLMLSPGAAAGAGAGSNTSSSMSVVVGNIRLTVPSEPSSSSSSSSSSSASSSSAVAAPALSSPTSTSPTFYKLSSAQTKQLEGMLMVHTFRPHTNNALLTSSSVLYKLYTNASWMQYLADSQLLSVSSCVTTLMELHPHLSELNRTEFWRLMDFVHERIAANNLIIEKPAANTSALMTQSYTSTTNPKGAQLFEQRMLSSKILRLIVIFASKLPQFMEFLNQVTKYMIDHTFGSGTRMTANVLTEFENAIKGFQLMLRGIRYAPYNALIDEFLKKLKAALKKKPKCVAIINTFDNTFHWPE
jgi:hypothetical protein